MCMETSIKWFKNKTSKEDLSSCVTDHFILAQFKKTKGGEKVLRKNSICLI